MSVTFDDMHLRADVHLSAAEITAEVERKAALVVVRMAGEEAETLLEMLNLKDPRSADE